MAEICESLDQAVLDIFQVLEDLYKKQAALEQVLKDGFLCMSRARYSMGVKRVTADQIVDADLTANRTVRVDMGSFGDMLDTDKEDDATAINDDENIQDVFKLCQVNLAGKGNKKNSVDSQDGNSKSVVRKRVTGAPAKDSDSSDKDWQEFKKTIEEIEGESNKTSKPKNPINLFGVLVPQALRSSQSSFEEAVRICIDIANEKHKLKMLQKKLKSLRSQKSESLSHSQLSSKKDAEVS